jgi:hypothetical protein
MIAQTLPITANQVSGRPDLPPKYTWVDPGHSCIAYIGGGSRDKPIYDLSYQVRHGSRVYLGQIERNPLTDCWLINNCQRTLLLLPESPTFTTWQEARDFLWEQFQASRRAAVKQQMEG